MAEISKSVGEGGANLPHDVALVQAMLRIVKNSKNAPYLAGNYDGSYGGQTKTAISGFQTDQKIPPPAPAIAKDKLGLVSPGGETMQKLTAMLPASHKELRVIENTKTVFLEASANDANVSKTAIANDAEFEPNFRAKVVQLVQDMFNQHKIVLWVTPTGRRRTFAQQAAETNTNAGPGESNHNFGRAVDIGFKHFKWVQGDGTVKKDADWLNALEAASAAKANALWDARDAIAFKLGLHRLQMERVHLQGFDQNKVSNSRSLVKLLNLVGKMKWEPQYKSDLGYGGKLFGVGTAKQIFAGNATVTKAMIAQAQSAKQGKAIKESQITADEVIALKKSLKGDFELADTNWVKWEAVPPS